MLNDESARNRIRSILREIETAIQEGRHAAETFERHTAPEYVFTSPSGVISSRREVLDGLRNETVRFSAYRMSDLDIRLYEQMAVVLGRADGDGSNPRGEVFRGAYRFTSVWLDTGPDWKLVAWQATAIVSDGDNE